MKHKILSISENAQDSNLLKDLEEELKRHKIKTEISVCQKGFSNLWIEFKDKEKAEKLASPIMLARFR